MRNRVNHTARPLKGHPHAFKDYDDDCVIHQSMVGFLTDIWRGAPGDSCFFLATSNPKGKHWSEHVVHGDNVVPGLNRFFHRHSRWDYNLYFCPNPFSNDRRKTKYARPTRLGWCDIDEADPYAFRPEASLITETSPGRFQGIWLWDGWHSPEEAEGYSRSMTDRHGGDSGWSITKMLRVPGSVNHKPQYDEPFVQLIHRNWNRISDRPPLPEIVRAMEVGDFINPDAHDPKEVYEKYRKQLHAKARTLIRHTRVKEKDRSSCIHLIIACLHEVGATPDEIGSILWHSPYFIEKHGYHIDRLDAEVTRVVGKLEAAQ